MRRIDLDPDDMPDDSSEERPFVLPEEKAHYVRDVLRLAPGDALEIFDGTGRILRGRLQKVDDRDVVCWIESDETSARAESPCEVTLFQAIPKGDRWTWVLEKATELGVSRVVPVETERTVVQIPDDRLDAKLDRWHRVVRAAARQCGRTVTPTLERPRSFREATTRQHERTNLHACFAPHPESERTLPEALDALDTTDESPACGLWIGPEGGFTPDELERLDAVGTTVAALGPRILRTETAAVASVTLVQRALGDLR
jgi:16S rRNA (uracil1498-N3)-methyltransferase